MTTLEYLQVVWVTALFLLGLCVAAGIVQAIGTGRLTSWIRLPRVGDHER